MSSNLRPNDDRLKMFAFGLVAENTYCNTAGLIVTQGQCAGFCYRETRDQTVFFMMSEAGLSKTLGLRSSVDDLPRQCGSSYSDGWFLHWRRSTGFADNDVEDKQPADAALKWLLQGTVAVI